MIWIDYTILAVILISAGVGLIRGLVQESLSLLNWTIALWVGVHYHPYLGLHLRGITDSGVRAVVSLIALFIGTLLVGRLLTYLIATLIAYTPLAVPNRIGGGLFGASRGLLLTLLLIFLASTVGLATEPWWQESRLLPVLEPWAGALGHLYPQNHLHLAHFP